MVGVTYHVSAVPAEVVDAKTSVEESPVAVQDTFICASLSARHVTAVRHQ